MGVRRGRAACASIDNKGAERCLCQAWLRGSSEGYSYLVYSGMVLSSSETLAV